MQRNINPIVNTALQHLTQSPNGIKTLMVMVGAHSFTQGYCRMPGNAGVAFRFKGSRKYNFCKLTWNAGTDTYWVRLGQMIKNGTDLKWKVSLTDGHAEDIKGFFETTTGLCLTIPTVKGINA